ncbi:MAG: winged helix-turn-helix transcriptional regulator [Thermoplasmata archaeon]
MKQKISQKSEGIQAFISEAPGLHLREIQRRLGIPLGTFRHHLQRLERLGLIHSEQDGRFRRFYSVGEVDPHQKRYFPVLRQKTPRRIVLHLMANETLTFVELQERLGLTSSSLSLHLKNLKERGIVDPQRTGSRIEYRLRDREAVAEILSRYRQSFLDRLVDSALEVYEESR